MAPAVAESEQRNQDDIRFIGISGQGSVEEMEFFVEDLNMDGFDHVADLNGEVWAVFGVTAQPSYVFINDDGTIRRHIGGLAPDELQEELDLLRAS